MYEVYSQQRPGRPRWAMGASAVVLLLTVALAAAVVQRKNRTMAVELGASQVFERGQLRCAIPAGWKLQEEAELQPGVTLLATEPAGRGRGRTLIVFRESPRPLGTPLTQGFAALKQFLVSSSLVDDPRELEPEPARIGPLPACDTVGVKSLPQPLVQITALSRLAIAPTGQSVGIILIVRGQESMRDRKLLDQFSNSVELLDLQPAKDKTAALREAGITYDLPPDLTVFPDPTPRSGCVHLIGGSGQESWYLTFARVPLLADRTPVSLVRDFCLTTLDKTEAPDEIVADRLGTRAYAQIRFALAAGQEKSLFVLCAQCDAQTALMMIGRYESQGYDGLSRVAHTLAERAIVAPYQERMDLDKAQADARAWLKDVASHGLKSIFGDIESRRAQFSIRVLTMTLATESRTLKSDRKDDQLWWDLRSETQYDRPPLRSLDQWRIRDDGRSLDYVSVLNESDRERRYTEKWTAGGPIHRELTTPDGDPVATTIDADALFVCEPLLIQAAASMTGGKSGAVFSSTETFTPGLCYWVITPLGDQPLPGPEKKTAPAAIIQRDFNPCPIVVYFGSNRDLRALSFMAGRYQIRTR